MKISMLLPTRGRPDRLNKFIESVATTTAHPENLEILIAVDQDDLASQSHVKYHITRYKGTLEIYMHIREQSEFINRDYYNWLSEKATGDLIWVLADDLVLNQFNWDDKIMPYVEEHFAKHEDRILCLSIRDNTPPPSHLLPKFPCFPMFSREAITACGWMLNPMTPTWGADYIAYKIYHPIGRLVEVHNECYLLHYSYHTKLAVVDKTSKRVGAIFNRLKMIPKYNTDIFLAEGVPLLRKKICEYIKNKEWLNARVE